MASPLKKTRHSKLLQQNGRLNIKPKGISIFRRKDVHSSLITMDWTSYFLMITFCFILINILFGSVYYMLGPSEFIGLLHKNGKDFFWEVFFFSTQTLTTLGYGRISPAGITANVVSAIESMTGVLLFAFATGLSYSRFAKPNPKLHYSKNILVSPYQDEKALMIRIVNYKMNQLVELDAEMVLTLNIEIEGEMKRFFYNLPLEQPKIGMMMMSWVLVHKITEDSPMYGLSSEDLEEEDAEILVMINGSDDILSHRVYSRTSYKSNRVIWDAEFVSINDTDDVGNIQIDISKMSDYRKL